MNLRLILWVFYSILLVCCASAAELLPNWKVLEQELSPDDFIKGPTTDVWTNSATLRTMVAKGDVPGLIELAGQSDRLASGSIAAFFALRKVNMDLARDVGLKIALTTSLETNIMVHFVLKQLGADAPGPTFKDALSRAFNFGPVNPVNVERLVYDLPLSALRQWFEDDKRGPSFPTCEALVLERLYHDLAKRHEQPTSKMSSVLKSYLNIPGIPRIIFLEYGDMSDPGFQTAFKATLEDGSISYYFIRDLVYSRPSYIRDHLDLRKLNAAEERIRSMTNDLAHALVTLPKKVAP